MHYRKQTGVEPCTVTAYWVTVNLGSYINDWLCPGHTTNLPKQQSPTHRSVDGLPLANGVIPLANGHCPLLALACVCNLL